MKNSRTGIIVALLLCYLSVFSSVALAQSKADSLAFENAPWQKSQVADGLRSYRSAIELFGKPQFISYITADTALYGLNVRQSRLRCSHTSSVAKREKAVAAINGAYFNTATGRPVSLIKESYKIKSNPHKDITKGGYVAIDSVSRITFGASADHLSEVEYSNPSSLYRDIVEGRKMLIIEDSIILNHSTEIHPRSAIGINHSGQLVMVVVDGRHSGSAIGVSDDQMAWIMRMLNCRDALHLDGGGSSTLWSQDGGVLNHPSDNKRFDNRGERAVGTVLYVTPRGKATSEQHYSNE